MHYFQRLYWIYMQNVNNTALQQGQIAELPPCGPGQTNRRALHLYLFSIRQSVGFAQEIYQLQVSDAVAGRREDVWHCVPLSGEDRGMVGAVPLWIFIYYCLRAGEFGIAIEELQQQQVQRRQDRTFAGVGGVGDKHLLLDVIHNSLMQLQQHQLRQQQQQRGGGSSSSESLVQSLVQCRRLYENHAVALRNHRGQDGGDGDDDDVYTDNDSDLIDPYALHLLRLCGLCDLDVASDNNKNNHINITNTVEDYLWTNVWYVWLSHIAVASNKAIRNPSSELGSAATFTEANLHEMIESFGGQAYFDPNYAQPFTYVNVLLCCQRYGEAVMHLWVAGKAFAAVQLLTVCVYYGLLIPHAKLLKQDTAAANMYRTSNSSSKMLQDFTPISMVQLWVQSYIANYPVHVVEYLVVLQRNSWFEHLGDVCNATQKEKHRIESQRELEAMWVAYLQQVLEVDHKRMSAGTVGHKNREFLTVLIGSSVDDSTRDCRRARTGYLDNYASYFPSSDYVNAVISQVAHLLLDEYKQNNRAAALSSSHIVMQGRYEEDALHLFTLAGKYVEVTDELCRHLASILSSAVTATTNTSGGGGHNSPVNVNITLLPNPKAQGSSNGSNTAKAAYWVEKCHTFYSKYVQGGSGMVMRSLTSQNRLDLPQSLEALLTVTSLFDNYAHGQYAEVMNIVDRLGVLPTSSAEVTVKAEGYHGMDKYMKSIMSDVLLVAMQCIKIVYDHYNVVKRGQSLFVGGGSATSGQSILGGSNSDAVVASDTDRIIANLQDRSKMLYMYVEVVKARGWSKPEYIAHIHRICHTIM